jgi:peptide-methionine (S)-S-oxide reductase
MSITQAGAGRDDELADARRVVSISPGPATQRVPFIPLETAMRWTRFVLLLIAAASGLAEAAVPDYAGAPPKTSAPGEATAVFAGGCFWGVDAVFKHLKGVTNVVSGYSGGSAGTAKYMIVGTGTTGHAESVKVTYDPSKIAYTELLKVFFSVAHDPTQRNRQGPDVGSQYRSAIFFANAQQQELAQHYIEQLNASKAFAKPIVTEVAPLDRFYPAEDYHQNYLALHPDQPYIVYNDLPKLEALKREFPGWYKQ